MKNYILAAIFLFGILFLAACNAAPAESPAEMTAAPVLPTHTPTLENTATPTPTVIASPTLTPTPTIALPVLENTPIPRALEPISRDNVDRLVAIGQYGTGLTESARSHDSRYISLATSIDVRLFDTLSGEVLWSRPIVAGRSAFSNDAKLLAINTVDGVEIWDVRSGQTLQVLSLEPKKYCFFYCAARTLSADESAIKTLVFSPDNKNLFVADQAGTLLVWNVVNAKLVSHPISPTGDAISFEISKNLLVIGKRGSASIDVWQIPEFTLLYSVQGPKSNYGFEPFTYISSDGTMAFSVNQNTSDPAILWSTEDGQIIKKIGSGYFFRPRLFDSQILMLQNASGNQLMEIGSWTTTKLPGETVLSFDKDNNRLVLGVDSGTWHQTRQGRAPQIKTIQIWNYVNKIWGKEREINLPSLIHLNSCSLSGENNLDLFCLSSDKGYAWINLNTGELKAIEKDNAYWPVSFSPSQQLFQAGNGIRKVSDGSLQYKITECCGGFLDDDSVVQIDMTKDRLELVDIETGEIRFQVNTNPKADAYYFSPDGTLLVRQSGDIFTLWNIKESTEIGRFSNPSPEYPYEEYNVVKFSVDGTRIYMNNEKNNIIDTSSGRVIGSSPAINHVAFSLDGQLVATQTGNVKIFDLKTNEMIGSLPTRCNSLAIASENKIVFCGLRTGDIQAWDMESEKLLFTTRAHLREVFSMTISRDETLLITTCIDGSTLLWSIWP